MARAAEQPPETVLVSLDPFQRNYLRRMEIEIIRRRSEGSIPAIIRPLGKLWMEDFCGLHCLYDTKLNGSLHYLTPVGAELLVWRFL
ncbi:hypothetical protein Nepgr_005996 [Nepenthes gracilis]|uniref:Uncharacterized protein n=1 Tax=Nepenthes gracilis TaxID=150966 RepID=A0AAD3S4P2_NEPGR|nr:hypothetical protein Nepgr_005996 [Nepenthes gracilis]